MPLTTVAFYNVSYGASTQSNVLIPLSALGQSLIVFVIPARVTQNPVVTFTVQNGNSSYVYQQTIRVLIPDQVVVDFYPATGYLTYNVPNQIFFQAWTNSSRTEGLDLSGVTLKQFISRTSTVTLYNANISSVANGKGSFIYTPPTVATALNPTFEFSYGGSNLVRSVSFAPNLFQSTIFSEAQIRILNANRALNSNENLNF